MRPKSLLTHVAFELPRIKRKRFAHQRVCSLLRESDFTRQAVVSGARKTTDNHNLYLQKATKPY